MDKEVRMEVANNITKYRKRAGMTQQELADVLGITKTSISNYEQNKTLIDLNSLYDFCNLLNIDINNILGKYAIKKENKIIDVKDFNDEEKEFLKILSKVINKII